MNKFINRISYENKVAINVCLGQGIFYAAWVFTCYSTVYLQSLGFTASTIGSIVAVNSAVGIFTAMFWGMLSDKINSIKKVLMIVITGLIVTYTLTPLLPTQASFTVPLFFVYYSLINAFKASSPILLDNMAIRTNVKFGLNYGFSRSLGSITFAVVSLLAVPFISKFGISSIFFAYGALALPVLVVLYFSYDPVVHFEKSVKKQKISLKPLLKNYYYVSFLIFACLFTTATSAEFSFLSYFMAEIGIDPNKLGTFLACRAICEIPLLFSIVKLRKRIKLKYLVIFAVLFMGLEGICLGFFAKNLVSMLFCGAIFGLGNGVFIGSATTYLFKLAPNNLKASAQSIYASIVAVAGIIGNLVGGNLFELLGARTFYKTLGTTMLVAGVIFAVSLLLNKKDENPADELN